MISVLVTGANGQLGECIKSLQSKYANINFVFTNRVNLDITNYHDLNNYFNSKRFDWCINCAAYTAVDKAESQKSQAYLVNVEGVENLAKITKEKNTKLIHISTDFVFDGDSCKAYTENSKANPLGVYGITKRQGELALMESNNCFFIIRTSWLYSEYKNNFLKTMLRLEKDRDEISVVSDQIGSPTYAKDLASIILTIISQNSEAYGIYHFSNEGVASWYDFAKAIFNITKSKIYVNPIASFEYPTPAKRPSFSVLNTNKIKKEFSLTIPYWRDSLKEAISKT